MSTIDATPVADEGERGDHLECTGNQRLQPGVVEEDQPGHRITQRGQQTSEEGIEPTRAAPAARAGRPANAKQVCGVTRLLWCVPPSVRRRPNDRSSGRRRRPPCKSAGFRSTLESGIRSAVIIPMRQQPGPMLIFRLTEDRRSRLDVGRNGGNPHSVPGALVIPLRRHRAAEEHVRGCLDRGSRRLAVFSPLRQQLWLWLDAVVAWLVTDYVWEAADTIPAWRQHPHLHEIAVLADQRRRAGHAFTNGLEEWHRYSRLALTERMTSRLRSYREDGHQAWPAKGHYTRHTAEASRRSREDRFAADVAAVRPTGGEASASSTAWAR